MALDRPLRFSWPIVLDTDAKFLRWVNSLHRDRCIKLVQQNQGSQGTTVIKNSVEAGDVVVLYDMVSYDSSLESLLTQRYLEKGK